MKKISVLLAVVFACVILQAQEHEMERLRTAGSVLREILKIPDNLPGTVLDKAHCVIVLPSVKKGAIGIGGSIGRGAMTCRSGKDFDGPWGPPAMYALESISVGFQLGGQATDFVLLVMNGEGVNHLLASKVKLGGDASAAAGPKGREAQAATDVTLRAEILTYSRSRGLFAGVSLDGSTLRPDGSASKKVYGREISAKEIVREGKVKTPEAGQLLVSALDRASPRRK